MKITLNSKSGNVPIGYLDSEGDLIFKRTDIENGADDNAVCITNEGSVWEWKYDDDEAVTFIYPGDSITIQF